MTSLWSRLFGKKDSIEVLTTARSPRLARLRQSPSQLPTRGSPRHACFACRGKHNVPWANCPACGNADSSVPEDPEWFAFLQAHVAAVQANDTAVRLFRDGRLDDAIAELRRGLDSNPQYATGYSNLGFLYLCKGQLEMAVESLLRALALDPRHKDAPNHLFDVLRAMTDELVQIGLTDGFLSTQPGGMFDDCHRHLRARQIGTYIVMMGQRGVFKIDGRVIESDLLLGMVINNVCQMIGAHSHSTGLQYAWEGIRG
jgi:tetratricopeptide (TPR) repeat protein